MSDTEPPDVALAYLSEDGDAERTAELVRARGRPCLTLRGDLSDAKHCDDVVARTVDEFGGVDVLGNNIATREPYGSPEEISDKAWLRTFEVDTGEVLAPVGGETMPG